MEGKDVPPPPEGLSRPLLSARPGGAPRRSRVGGWALAAVLGGLALVLYAVRYALLPFVFAAAIGFVADPFIRALQRRLYSPRWPIAIGIYLIFLATLCAGIYWIGSAAAADLTSVAAHAPQIARNLIAQAVGSDGVVLLGQAYTPDQLVQLMGEGMHAIVGTGGLAALARSTIAAIVSGFLLLVLVPYFLVSGPRLAAGAIWLLPPERRHSVESLLPMLVPVLRRYLIGLVLVVFYTATAGWIGFGLVFHLHGAVLLAIATGLLELLPVVGPLASATIVGLVAFQQASVWGALFLMAFAIGLRLSIDNIVGPLVLGQAARVHPVVVIMGFVCGVMLFGIVGLLLAVPVAVVIKTTLQHYYAEPVRAREER